MINVSDDGDIREYNSIVIDYSRDKDLPEQGRVMLTKKGFYKKDGEDSPQETFARASVCYSFGDYELAQRIYDAASKKWFTNASPVLTNAVNIDWPTFTKDQFEEAGDWLEENIEPEGMPISCFLPLVPDTKEGLVETRSETEWLSMMGGGVGIYMSNRAPDEKSTGVMAHLKGYDADALAYKQTECYVPETEILTGRGWVRFDMTIPDDVVATVDNDGKLTFEKPAEWLTYDYAGKMVNLKMNRKGLNLKVTPNHNLVVKRKRTGGWSALEKIEASSLKLHNEIKFLTSSVFDGGTVDKLTPIERLMIAHQADGHNNKLTNSLSFHFSKDRKTERLNEILEECGIEYTLTYGKTDDTRFYVKHNHLPKDLNWIDLSTTSQAKAVAYLDEIAYWDGHVNRKGQIQYSSIDEANIDTVQALAVMAGYGSCKSRYEPKKSHWKTMYSITVKVRNHFLAEKLEVSTYDYDGKVYCCTVNSGNLVIRAGVCPLICGNSRRGSIAAYLDITHPEILSFIDMRSPTGGEVNKKCFNLNHGINITDDFMVKALTGQKYELIDPKHGNTGQFLNAQEVWESILDSRYATGEPYLHFIDTVNRNLPKWITKPTYHVRQSNLC